MAEIEYFYAAHSAFAWIGHAELRRIAREGGHRIIHRPYDLRVVLAALGPGATGGLTPERRRYFFGREIERWAEFRGLVVPPGMPTHHARPIAPSNRLLIAAADAGADVDGLSGRLLEAHWVEDADLADEATLVALSAELGLDGEALVAAAASEAIGRRYEANTAEAIARPVFGSPTYFVGGDMFYGQDRLALVERALRQPFRGGWLPAAGG